MSDQKLSFDFQIKIQAPIETTFAAVSDGETISEYFTDASTGPLEPDQTVYWSFGDFRVDIRTETAIQNQTLVCNWPACNSVGYRTQFTFEFSAISDSVTVVSVRETGWQNDPAGIDSAMSQCSGWTHFFASLKAYLEHNAPIKDFYTSHE